MTTEQIADDLSAVVGPENVRTNADAVKAAQSSWQPALVKARQIADAHGAPEIKGAVVLPGNADEVVRIVRWANQTRTPLIVVGGASNTVGSNSEKSAGSAERGRVAVKMSRLLDVEWQEENLLVHAGAGVVLGDLEEQLNAHDYTLGHLPHSLRLATVGGCVATNALGILAGKYGRQADLTTGLQIVLPTGEIMETNAQNAPGANAAFNLHDLFIGSEAAFGIVTRATLRMRPVPEARAWAAFSFATFDDGIDALRLIYRSDSRPALVRLFGKNESAVRLNGQAGFLLLLAFEGDELTQTGPYQLACGVCQAVGGTAQSADLGDEWWADNVKNGTAWLAPNARPGGLADGFAFGVSWDKIKAVKRATENALLPLVEKLNVHIAYASPNGAALDIIWQAEAQSAEASQTLLKTITKTGLYAAQNAGAGIAHHYGIGSARRDAFARERGNAGITALKTIQSALDPNGILRPVAFE